MTIEPYDPFNLTGHRLIEIATLLRMWDYPSQEDWDGLLRIKFVLVTLLIAVNAQKRGCRESGQLRVFAPREAALLLMCRDPFFKC